MSTENKHYSIEDRDRIQAYQNVQNNLSSPRQRSTTIQKSHTQKNMQGEQLQDINASKSIIKNNKSAKKLIENKEKGREIKQNNEKIVEECLNNTTQNSLMRRILARKNDSQQSIQKSQALENCNSSQQCQYTHKDQKQLNNNQQTTIQQINVHGASQHTTQKQFQFNLNLFENEFINSKITERKRNFFAKTTIINKFQDFSIGVNMMTIDIPNKESYKDLQSIERQINFNNKILSDKSNSFHIKRTFGNKSPVTALEQPKNLMKSTFENSVQSDFIIQKINVPKMITTPTTAKESSSQNKYPIEMFCNLNKAIFHSNQQNSYRNNQNQINQLINHNNANNNDNKTDRSSQQINSSAIQLAYCRRLNQLNHDILKKKNDVKLSLSLEQTLELSNCEINKENEDNKIQISQSIDQLSLSIDEIQKVNSIHQNEMEDLEKDKKQEKSIPKQMKQPIPLQLQKIQSQQQTIQVQEIRNIHNYSQQQQALQLYHLQHHLKDINIQNQRNNPLINQSLKISQQKQNKLQFQQSISNSTKNDQENIKDMKYLDENKIVNENIIENTLEKVQSPKEMKQDIIENSQTESGITIKESEFIEQKDYVQLYRQQFTNRIHPQFQTESSMHCDQQSSPQSNNYQLEDKNNTLQTQYDPDTNKFIHFPIFIKNVSPSKNVKTILSYINQNASSLDKKLLQKKKNYFFETNLFKKQKNISLNSNKNVESKEQELHFKTDNSNTQNNNYFQNKKLEQDDQAQYNIQYKQSERYSINKVDKGTTTQNKESQTRIEPLQSNTNNINIQILNIKIPNERQINFLHSQKCQNEQNSQYLFQSNTIIQNNPQFAKDSKFTLLDFKCSRETQKQLQEDSNLRNKQERTISHVQNNPRLKTINFSQYKSNQNEQLLSLYLKNSLSNKSLKKDLTSPKNINYFCSSKLLQSKSSSKMLPLSQSIMDQGSICLTQENSSPIIQFQQHSNLINLNEKERLNTSKELPLLQPYYNSKNQSTVTFSELSNQKFTLLDLTQSQKKIDTNKNQLQYNFKQSQIIS